MRSGVHFEDPGSLGSRGFRFSSTYLGCVQRAADQRLTVREPGEECKGGTASGGEGGVLARSSDRKWTLHKPSAGQSVWLGDPPAKPL